ncbi:type VII secretion integral membrane protein EccD [Rhodococcoides kyotonense]|uniref:Type VII secretion integral membrane protein EccD n=1 Tax=Rhodococcoides kyotonense TaxID=398843 RepID=A0A239MP99_9NOCA|nr:type VII secretion integral membrane protein EccD [Rhodococcus kyotonensis]SNT44495.1 type VII secretion integral membrane protein EccD [Rhodococcus kyotonensis]
MAGDQAGHAAAAMDLCRLTVVAESVQVDMALPTDVPLALLLPGIVDILERRSGGPPAARRQPLVLGRVGRPPLSGTRTLDESGVRDGELLVLGDAESPAPAPLFDDLMFAVATTGADGVSLWSAKTAQTVGFVVAAVALVLGCSGALLTALRRSPDEAPALAILVATTATVLLVAGSVSTRIGRDRRTGVFLSASAVTLAGTAGVLFVPIPLGAPHLMLGATAVGVFAVLALRLGGDGSALFTGTAVTAFMAGIAGAVAEFTGLPIATIGGGTGVVALAGLTFAPRLSMMQARLPLPPVPTAGAPLDTYDEDDASSYDDLHVTARDARSYMTGLVCAGSLVTAVGVLVAASTHTGDTYWPGITLAALTASVLLLRGRTFAEAHQAVPLVAAGAAVVLGLLAAAILRFTSQPMTTFLVATAAAVLALLFGSVVPRREYSPVLRRAAELVEYAAIAGIVPVACWVCGLYSAMRAL